MFNKILIANRGEIACRVAATCARLGVQTVAVYSDADAHAQHVSVCDQAVHIGGSAPRQSYLRWEAIIEAALATGAQAVHPGYGFLSENEDFAAACAKAGLVFIGPPASAIKAMGLKAESKQLMERAGVPLVPGYHGADQAPDLLQREANRIGYPVLIKASAGGGGKGMRAVEREQDFAAALASCQREAVNSFGDAAVLIEKYVQRPRHIEIQVFGDTQGNFVYLFERDCSVQRRHQKVLEEAPAPGMTAAMREQMGLAAVAAARAVNYVGAGTVEFIVETRDAPLDHSLSAAGPPQGAKAPPGGREDTSVPNVGAFYFMEMNTRLQVEHPVTEAITGQDLVEWQLRVASGEPLPLRQDQLRMSGHAIEARICAETPDQQFLPATGHLATLRWPAHVAFSRNADHFAEHAAAPVRVDAGVRQGDAISPHYDSMVAKLIVHGDNREQALARLDSALAQTHIVGLSTNVQFLRHVLSSESFSRAQLDTGLIAREQAVLFNQERLGVWRTAAAAVAHTLIGERNASRADPFDQRDHWQSHAATQRRFEFVHREQTVSATLFVGHDGAMELAVAGQREPLRFASTDQGVELHIGSERQVFQVYAWGEERHVFAAQGAGRITVVDLLAHAGEVHSEGGRLTAPMPGKVVSILVKVGDKVSKGQPLAVMEAMKMEHTIAAPSDGVVLELLYAPGDQVAEGSELLKLALG